MASHLTARITNSFLNILSAAGWSALLGVLCVCGVMVPQLLLKGDCPSIDLIVCAGEQSGLVNWHD